MSDGYPSSSRSVPEQIRVARRPEHTVAGTLVLIAGAALGLALLWLMARTVSFPPLHQPGVVGWSTVHRYPEYQEQIYFILAVAGVPAVAGLSWLAWARTLSSGGSLAAAAHGLSRWGHTLALRVAAAAGPHRAAAAGTGRTLADSAATSWTRTLGSIVTWVLTPTLLYWIRFAPHPGDFDAFHDGEMLVPLLELLHGGVPYRDIYLQHGLLHNALIPWLGAKLFGATVHGVWLIGSIVQPLGGVALYYYAVTVFRGRGVTAAVLAFFLCGAILGAPGRTTFGFLSLALVSASIPNCRPPLLAGAGLLAALAFWHSVEIGLYTAGAVTAFLWIGGCRPRRRALGWFLTAFSAGLGVVAMIFLLVGALDDLVRNVGVQIAYQSTVWGLPFPSFSAVVAHLADARWPGSFGSGGMLFYLPPACFVVAGVWLVNRLVRGRLFDSPADLRLLLVVLAGVCFFRSVLGRSDGAHLRYGVAFMTLLALYVPDRLLTGSRSWPRILAGLAAAAVVGSYAWGVYRPMPGLLSRVASKLDARSDPRGGADPTQPIALVVDAIRARTVPGERVFDFSNQAAILFLADRRSATRYFHANYIVTESMQREVIDALEKLRPVAILEGGSSTDSFDGVPQSVRTPLIAEFLRANYEPVRVAGTGYVLGLPQRAPAPPPAVRLPRE